MIEIVNLRDEKPSCDFDFYIDRSSPLGNPFWMNHESQRDDVCDKYEKHFNHKVAAKDFDVMYELASLISAYKTNGRLRLFCWCAPKRCHGETIKKYLEDQIVKQKIVY